jgi:hypothetical protein
VAARRDFMVDGSKSGASIFCSDRQPLEFLRTPTNSTNSDSERFRRDFVLRKRREPEERVRETEAEAED